jgi:hypothetical protein
MRIAMREGCCTMGKQIKSNQSNRNQLKWYIGAGGRRRHHCARQQTSGYSKPRCSGSTGTPTLSSALLVRRLLGVDACQFPSAETMNACAAISLERFCNGSQGSFLGVEAVPQEKRGQERSNRLALAGEDNASSGHESGHCDSHWAAG